MRAYVTTTGLLYLALILAHFARLAAEGASPLSSPVFLLTTLAAAAMVVWSWRVYRRLPQAAS